MMMVVKMVAEVAPRYILEEMRVRKMIYRQVLLVNICRVYCNEFIHIARAEVALVAVTEVPNITTLEQ
jgi:hypothetical protein